MLSKCANPDCSARFRYLHDGKIFRVDFEAHPHLRRAQLPEPSAGIPVIRSGARLLSGEARPAEYFWLCSACSEQMTLAVKADSVILLPLAQAFAQRAAAS
jgi:hypothetical protein